MNIRACEDCGDDEDHVRRVRCEQCGLLLCAWCFNRVHRESIKANRPCRTQRPGMLTPPVSRYADA